VVVRRFDLEDRVLALDEDPTEMMHVLPGRGLSEAQLLE
jgi:hypothetical protein